MPAVNSTPVLAWVQTLLAGAGLAQSSYLTVTVHLTQGWEIQIPVKALFTTVSADPVVNIYPSSDGGPTYDTTPFASFSIARVTNAASQVSVRLPTGQYVLQILNSGPNTATFWVQTQQVLSAVQNL